ncbi:glycoside hydrolase domain-containing protein [Rufibacter sediminis]|uniref:Glycoside hydrolase family 92 protein n=2 Tax=Rufibacter sediminis TaxID=2762756 RepID=A0ABR6VS68_9BACT|nr:glycoside hydrolase domain-containing protein [Rufibacter sediminis]MBC3540034.1 glycoside hydrolase family 92 protein [Rufibacter sediminis]
MRLLTFCFTVFFFCSCSVQKTEKGTSFSGPFGKNTAKTELVNVFLGSSGDHGQLSPAASYPFSMMSIGPQTYPTTHMGYEYLAKTFLGFTLNRFEGVGCEGSGGNILLKPFLGKDPKASTLTKVSETAGPGFYQVGFSNQIKAEMTVYKKSGLQRYQFPAGEKGISIDLSHAFVNRFVAEEHSMDGSSVSGWIDSKTTCSAGTYRLYYYLRFRQPVQWSQQGKHQLIATLPTDQKVAEIEIGFSSVDVSYAKASLETGSFEEIKLKTAQDWNQMLGHIQVKGDPEREKLFYSLLYRTLQSPYVVSENDGTYRATDGTRQTSQTQVYNGWSIWDNYKTQLPLLSLVYPDQFRNIASSIANLYRFGKKDYATAHEPSNTVRTEHAIVVLLDAYRKGYPLKVQSICDSLVQEVNKLDYSRPDKTLESSYDAWALSQILAELGQKDLSKRYRQKALEYKTYWNKDFKDLTRPDVDRMSVRGMYQGTVWQYRWSVPFDVKGLIGQTGGKEAFVQQLDEFFGRDLFNRANEPDLQVPTLYNASAEPWKAQALMHKLAVDTVVQHYFNDNSRGIGSYVGPIFKNQPAAYLRTMDDDAGAMSSWFVFAATGVYPAAVGWPVYYLHVPLFEKVAFNWPDGKSFSIEVNDHTAKACYVKEAYLNGEKLTRNWLTHDEITRGGNLTIVASSTPEKTWGVENQWVSKMEATE